MVSTGMKRYRVRTATQATVIGDAGSSGPIDTRTLFGRVAPVRLDIGFGHGEFISQMAASHPEEDFLGVERIDIRVTKTAHKSTTISDGGNIRLFHDEAHHFVRFRLAPAALRRAYLLFPDPWPRPKHRRRRLVNRSFLIDLAHAMEPGGVFLFASDTHNYAMQVLTQASIMTGIWEATFAPAGYRFDIPTRFPTVFERYKKAEGWSIAYVGLRRTSEPAPERVPWRPRPN
jgi:tRNA (guanine-N7-)-methyltransferase